MADSGNPNLQLVGADVIADLAAQPGALTEVEAPLLAAAARAKLEDAYLALQDGTAPLPTDAVGIDLGSSFEAIAGLRAKFISDQARGGGLSPGVSERLIERLALAA